MVLVKNWPFFHLFFKGNIGKENVFYDILERKNAFLGYKNKKFNKWKNCHFSKGFSMVLVKNWPFFHLFLGGQRRPGKCVLRYSRTINVFLSYENQKFKKSKIVIFSKGWVHGFGQRLAIFANFFLRQYGRGFFFWTSCFYSLEKRFLVLEYAKTHFPGLYYL